MMRRLTITCGLLTLAVVLALALQDHSLFGARTPHHKGAQVTTVPDRPASWPPVKPVPPAPPLKALPPAPQPAPLHRASPAPASAPRATGAGQLVVQIANALFNLPKIIHDQTQAKPGD